MDEAAFGCRVQIPTLKDSAELEIPAGTQSGTVFRIRNKGIKHLKLKEYGDLYVNVVVEVQAWNRDLEMSPYNVLHLSFLMSG